MTQTVIRVEGLGKRYRIGQGVQHNALRNLIGDALRAPVRLFRNGNEIRTEMPGRRPRDGPSANETDRRGKQFIWALKDVTFDVQEGEDFTSHGRPCGDSRPHG